MKMRSTTFEAHLQTWYRNLPRPTLRTQAEEGVVTATPSHHHLSSRANPESSLNTWFSGFQLWKMCKIAAFVQNGGSKGRNVGEVIGFLYSTGMPDRTITDIMQLINNTFEETFAEYSGKILH